MIEGHSHDSALYNTPTKGLQYDLVSGDTSYDTIVMANLVSYHVYLVIKRAEVNFSSIKTAWLSGHSTLKGASSKTCQTLNDFGQTLAEYFTL